jgi:hypothetical protein
MVAVSIYNEDCNVDLLFSSILYRKLTSSIYNVLDEICKEDRVCL